MTDPWENERERAEKARGYVDDGLPAWNWHVRSLEDVERLLAEADALLAMVPFAGHLDRCLRVNYGVRHECDCGYTKALAALPEHLKGDTNQ